MVAEQRTEERALNSWLWNSCVAAPGIAKGDAGRAAGSVGFWSPEGKAKAQRGSRLVGVSYLSCFWAWPGVSETSPQGEELCLWAAWLRQRLNRGLRNHSFGIGHLKWKLKLKIHHIPLQSQALASVSFMQLRWHLVTSFSKASLQCVRSFVPLPIKVAMFEPLHVNLIDNSEVTREPQGLSGWLVFLL